VAQYDYNRIMVIRRRVLLLLALIVLVALVVAGIMSTPQPPERAPFWSMYRPFTKGDYDRLRKGMTYIEVEKIMGGMHADRADFQGLEDCYLWTDPGVGTVGIVFDQDQRVEAMTAKWYRQ
jgi:hypothetical protein